MNEKHGKTESGYEELTMLDLSEYNRNWEHKIITSVWITSLRDSGELLKKSSCCRVRFGSLPSISSFHQSMRITTAWWWFKAIERVIIPELHQHMSWPCRCCWIIPAKQKLLALHFSLCLGRMLWQRWMELHWRQEKRICSVLACLFYGWSWSLQARAMPRWCPAAEKVVARLADFQCVGICNQFYGK